MPVSLAVVQAARRDLQSGPPPRRRWRAPAAAALAAAGAVWACGQLLQQQQDPSRTAPRPVLADTSAPAEAEPAAAAEAEPERAAALPAAGARPPGGGGQLAARVRLAGWRAARELPLRAVTLQELRSAAGTAAPPGRAVEMLWTERRVRSSTVRVSVESDDDLLDALADGSVIHASLGDPPPRDPDACPPRPRRYHTVMTTGPGVYERWQGRVMYWWYKRHRANDPCGEMGGFTRLMYGQDDPYVKEIPTVVVPKVPNDYGFVVLNRPHSFREWLRRVGTGEIRLQEDWVLLCEPDHLMIKPLPNMAPLGFHFYYMHAAEERLEKAILPHLPPGASPFAPGLPPTGPSPALMHIDDWRRVTPAWHDRSFQLKRDKAADRAFGWVLEMWGFITALVETGVWLNVTAALQCEPNSGYPALHSTYVVSDAQVEEWARRRSLGPWFLHLTFEMAFYGNGSAWLPGVTPAEKAHRGQPQWSWNKRNYYGKYPPRNAAYPPKGATAGKHIPAATVVEMFNAATAELPDWGKETGIGRGTCHDGSDSSPGGGDASPACGGGRRRGMIRRLRIQEPWPRSGVRPPRPAA